MSIPLVQNNEKDSINTSIIAIKKNLERINSILGLVDSGSDIDTSEFVKKSDIVDVVQSGNMQPVTSNAVVPVDTVTSGDMHSVTSNAVANYVGTRYITSGSVHPTSEAYFEICRLNLPAGKYLIIGYSQINRSINRVYNFRIIGNDMDRTVRGNSNNGGGIINSIICQKNESFNVIAYGYGFSEYVNDANVQQIVSLQALKIGN